MSDEQQPQRPQEPQVGSVELDRAEILCRAQEAAWAMSGSELLRGFTALKDRGLSGLEEVKSLQEALQTLDTYLGRIETALNQGCAMPVIDQKAEEFRRVRQEGINDFEGQS
ncbi:MAG: hypothetical protein ABIJ33_03905 [Patescibacteria group bacterium]